MFQKYIVYALLLMPTSAFAARLTVEPDASWFFHVGAAILLYAHIAGGTAGFVSGIVASVTRKGAKIHRAAGKTFFYSMALCYGIGAIIAPFLDTEQRTNFVAALLALYLLLSGVRAAQHKVFVAGVAERIGLFVALSITFMGIWFMYMANNSPTGTVDGAPPQSFVLYVIAGSFAAIGELQALFKKQLSHTIRICRHLWRMCFSFLIASGSLFMGQAQMLPDWFNQTVLPTLFILFPLVILIIGLIQMAFKHRLFRLTEKLN